MASLNKVFLMGNLTRDPELRYTPDGTPVADLRLAVNDSYTGRDGNKVDRTLFIDVAVWRRQAETASEYLSKGRPVLVEGRLQLDEWENQQGEKQSKIRVVAQNVQFLGSPRGEGGGQGGQASRGARPARPAPARGEGPPDEGPGPDDVPSQDIGEDDIPF
jgi:single-strand DNA-binding protein